MNQQLKNKLEQERVTALFEQSSSVVVANMASGLLYSFVLSNQGFGRGIWIWFAVLFAVVMLRRAMYQRFAAQPKDQRIPAIWLRRYGVAILVTGSLWGLAGAFAIANGTVTAGFLTVAVLAGMVGGSVATCAVSPAIFLLFTAPTLVPPSLALMAKGDSEGFLIGSLLMIYGAIVTRSVFQIQRVILESIRHRFENERLLEEREQEKQQIQASESALRKAYEKLETAHSALIKQRGLVDRERDISAQLRELDRMKDEFLAKTSHELRTPLFGISGLAEALIDDVHGPLPQAAKEDLSMVVDSSHRLSRLVDDLLEFAKLRHGNPRLTKQPVDVHSLADIVLTLARPRATMKGLELRNEIDATPPLVLADEDRVHQILHNLVHNAIKFTERGSITLGARPDGEFLQLSVTDTGTGISPAERSRIFDAFEQGAAAKLSQGGTGLGLAITKKLVELHGGELDLTPSRLSAGSDARPGTTFTFTLPLCGPDDAVGVPPYALTSPAPTLPATKSPTNEEAPVAAEGAEKASIERKLLITPNGDVSKAAHPGVGAKSDDAIGSGPARFRVLAIDDEVVNLRILRNFLADEPIDLHLASDAEQALELIEVLDFDLLLVDVMMPKVSGFDLCRKVRRRYLPTELPLLFLTARGRDQDVAAGLDVGANDYIVKPFSKSVVLSRIHLHLRLLEAHRGLGALVDEKVAELKILQGLLPICASCKKIRDDDGEWNEIESYVSSRTEVEFSHGFCPDCLDAYLAMNAELTIDPDGLE